MIGILVAYVGKIKSANTESLFVPNKNGHIYPKEDRRTFHLGTDWFHDTCECKPQEYYQATLRQQWEDYVAKHGMPRTIYIYKMDN